MACLLGMQRNWLEAEEIVGQVDLCVQFSIPPNTKEFTEMKLAHTVAGTDLLEHVVEHASGFLDLVRNLNQFFDQKNEINEKLAVRELTLVSPATSSRAWGRR
jgi:hypothetical protein